MNPTPRFLSIVLFARFPGVRVVLALLLVAVLSGCANVISAKVTSFNDWPADAAGGTFAMAPHSGKGSELEQRTWDNHVAAELRRLGLVPVAAGQTPRFWVDTTATRESRVKHAREPIYQQDTVYVPPYRDAAGNVIAGHWAPDPFGPRWVTVMWPTRCRSAVCGCGSTKALRRRAFAPVRCLMPRPRTRAVSRGSCLSWCRSLSRRFLTGSPVRTVRCVSCNLTWKPVSRCGAEQPAGRARPVQACRLRRLASMAAAVASGFSMGKRWVPSSIMQRPRIRRWVISMPTWRISSERMPPMKATGHLSG